jgi:DNA-binding Lrp family transcriptional regulator
VPNPRQAFSRGCGFRRGRPDGWFRENRHNSTVWENPDAINQHSLLIKPIFIVSNAIIWLSVVAGGVMGRLDGVDEQILAELAQHARATFAEIGERVNLSAPAVKRRVDRMLDSGVIRGFTTVIDRNAVGWNTEAYVQVFCHGRISPDVLRRAWTDIPEVVSAATATGTADAILRVLAHDMQHLEDALERIRTAADIDRTESIVVLSNLIDRSRVEDTAALHRHRRP